MMRCSRPMSWAVDRTWLIGGRRSTIRRPVASVTTKVRLERPPAISSNVNGTVVPSTLLTSHAVTAAASMPAVTGSALPAELRLHPAHATQPPLSVVGPAALIGRDLRMRQDQEVLCRDCLDHARRHLVGGQHAVH